VFTIVQPHKGHISDSGLKPDSDLISQILQTLSLVLSRYLFSFLLPLCLVLTGRIILLYYAKSVNIIAGGSGGGVVSNDKEVGATATASSKSLGKDLSTDGSFRIDGQRLYNLSIHNNYAAHYIIINVKGKRFQFYTFTFG
jgi:hypothetical protein